MSVYNKQCGSCKTEPAFCWVEQRGMWLCKKCFELTWVQESNTQFREDVRACLINLSTDPQARSQPWEAVIKSAIAGAEEIEKQLKEKGRL